MVAASAFADCHHWAERYVVPPYQRCNPAAASALMAAFGGSVSLAQTRLSTAVTSRTNARGRARGTGKEKSWGRGLIQSAEGAGRPRRVTEHSSIHQEGA